MSKMKIIKSCGACDSMSDKIRDVEHPYCFELMITKGEKNFNIDDPEKVLPNCPLDDYPDGIEDKLDKIKSWCEAYPLKVFPEPDLKKTAKVLKDNGMTIDSIGASSMRHVLKGIIKIIEGEE